MGFFSRKNKKIQIEFCQKNLDRFLTEESTKNLGLFLKNGQVQYKEYECLSYCKFCKTTPYVQINGECIASEQYETLIPLIEEKIHSK